MAWPAMGKRKMRLSSSIHHMDRPIGHPEGGFAERFGKSGVSVADVGQVLGLAPNSMAATASAIRSPARGPRIWTPRIRSVCASASIFTWPSVSPNVRARPLA